jgi:hypothetical protein
MLCRKCNPHYPLAMIQMTILLFLSKAAISQIHQAFGFPNKFRKATPNNLFQYHYRVDGTPILERTSGGTWVGDLTLQTRKSVFEKNPESELELLSQSGQQMILGLRWKRSVISGMQAAAYPSLVIAFHRFS